MTKITKIMGIVEKYRKAQGNGKPLPYRAFADELNDVDGVNVTHQLVAYWENGERIPSMDILLAIIIKTEPTDWRHAFASELMSAKFE